MKQSELSAPALSLGWPGSAGAQLKKREYRRHGERQKGRAVLSHVGVLLGGAQFFPKYRKLAIGLLAMPVKIAFLHTTS
jgi:hypothetical protein